MAEFQRDKLEMYLAVVRKYMQLRGSLTQKDLADMAEIGVSTMSRFLNQKTSDLNPNLIAKITAVLNIPLHEMIEFVDEGFTDQFVRLVKFYKEGTSSGESIPNMSGDNSEAASDEAFVSSLSSGTAQKNVKANINVGGKSRTLSFQADEGGRNSEGTIREKMQSLSARQKGFLTDFLNLDTDGRDLIVDIGKNLITYLRQKGMDL